MKRLNIFLTSFASSSGFEDRKIVRASEYKTQRLPFSDYVSVETHRNAGRTEPETELD